jgi:hypothetical protein
MRSLFICIPYLIFLVAKIEKNEMGTARRGHGERFIQRLVRKPEE